MTPDLLLTSQMCSYRASRACGEWFVVGAFIKGKHTYAWGSVYT